jgi:hypothetical protein
MHCILIYDLFALSGDLWHRLECVTKKLNELESSNAITAQMNRHIFDSINGLANELDPEAFSSLYKSFLDEMKASCPSYFTYEKETWSSKTELWALCFRGANTPKGINHSQIYCLLFIVYCLLFIVYCLVQVIKLLKLSTHDGFVC